MVPVTHLTITAVDGGWVLAGELDSSSASALETALSQLNTGETTVDVAEVSFMDSSGLRVLVEASVRATNEGGSLLLLHPQRAIQRLVSLSGLGGHLFFSDEPS